VNPTETALAGDELLAAVTDAMVTFHERYHGRKPGSAKSQLMGDDLLACVLGGVYTEVEKTAFISNSHVGPDLEVEIFLLEPRA
jgi:hypothetical protein